jgi:hypothetical protein
VDRERRREPVWTYGWWLAVGVLAGIGIAGLLTVGIVFVVAAGVLGAVGVAVPALRSRAVVVVPAGLAVVPAYLAWLNRDGPGSVCETSAGGATCTEEWTPWPFVAAAVLLVVVAVVLALAVRRKPVSPAR